MTTVNQTKFTLALQALLNGLVKHAALVASLLLGGTSMSNADLVTKLEGLLTLATAAVTARMSARAAVQADRASRAANRQFLEDLKQALRSAFSGQPDVLADFGLTPRKKAVRKPKTAVAAAAKADATREARGTKGPKARLETKGNVTGIEVVPIVAPPAEPAPAPEPPKPDAPPAPATPATYKS